VTTVGAQNAGVERIAAAFAGSGKRAALMPYLMGGFPDLPGSLRIGEAYADGGADLVELGVPFSDPLADGPVIHAAATRALAAGANMHEILEAARRITGPSASGSENGKPSSMMSAPPSTAAFASSGVSGSAIR